MESQQMENRRRQRLSQISKDEVDVINDIRELNFGRINIVIQDGVIVSKEITKIVRNGRGRNRNNGKQNTEGGKSVGVSGDSYSNEEEMY